MAYTSEIEKLERRHQENPKGRTFAILADHYRKAGEFDRAIALLKEGLEVHPDYPSALIVLGRCRLDMGEDAEAEVPFRRVLDLDHENGIALRAMADIAERRGRHAEARRWLETLLAIDAGNEGARAQLNRVSEAIVPPSHEIDPILAEEAVIGSIDPPETPSLLEDEESWGDQEETPAEGMILDDPPETGLVEHESEALPDLEADGPPEDEELDIGVIRAEEIVLRASESTEYQVSNDADSLLNDLPAPEQAETAPAETAPEEDETFPDEPEMGYFEEDAPHPYSPQNWDVPAGSAPPAAAQERLAGWEGSFPGDDAGGDEPPAISGESGSPMQEHDEPAVEEVPGWWSEEGGRVPEPPMAAEYVEHGPGSGQEEPVEEQEPVEPEPLSVAANLPSDENYGEEGRGKREEEQSREEGGGKGEGEEDWEEGDGKREAGEVQGEQGVESHAGAFGITETLAEIYLAQGHHREAAEVYRQLLAGNPDSNRLQEKLAGAEARASGGRTERPSYSAGQSGGQSVEGYFAELLAARPAPGEPVPDVPAGESDSVPSRPPGSAAPTRPATDSLSLSAIFGEDGPESQAAQAPDHPPGAPPAAPGMSFDEFFGPGGDRPQARPSRGSAEGDEDLTQFHDWLKSLKS